MTNMLSDGNTTVKKKITENATKRSKSSDGRVLKTAHPRALYTSEHHALTTSASTMLSSRQRPTFVRRNLHRQKVRQEKFNPDFASRDDERVPKSSPSAASSTTVGAHPATVALGVYSACLELSVSVLLQERHFEQNIARTTRLEN